ncbi:hypothetical protein OHB00_06480 [Streptomyces sp. NBC_00631]|uniref:hypothetical protein n=1 Tax=Streptomyces sp. NBC_00631 TaxID=2975793 RepID=UPI0030E5D523
MNRFRYVADHHRRCGVKWRCAIVGIARSSFSYWCRTAADRAARPGFAGKTRGRA